MVIFIMSRVVNGDRSDRSVIRRYGSWTYGLLKRRRVDETVIENFLDDSIFLKFGICGYLFFFAYSFQLGNCESS